MSAMKLVIIESPFAGDIIRNKEYLHLCVLDCLRRGESPYASHGFFTQFLDDTVPEQRELGIKAGLEWARVADKVVFYLDYGWSPGMKAAHEWHLGQGREIETRILRT